MQHKVEGPLMGLSIVPCSQHRVAPLPQTTGGLWLVRFPVGMNVFVSRGLLWGFCEQYVLQGTNSSVQCASYSVLALTWTCWHGDARPPLAWAVHVSYSEALVLAYKTWSVLQRWCTDQRRASVVFGPCKYGSIFFLRRINLGCLTKIVNGKGHKPLLWEALKLYFQLQFSSVITLAPPVFWEEDAFLIDQACCPKESCSESSTVWLWAWESFSRGPVQQTCSLLSLSELLQGWTMKQPYQNKCFPLWNTLVMNMVNEISDSFAVPWLIYCSVPHCVTLRTENAHCCAYKLVFWKGFLWLSFANFTHCEDHCVSFTLKLRDCFRLA